MNAPRLKKKLPRDANQLAKAIVDNATGDELCEPPESTKAAAGRKGGLRGGESRAKKLTAKERSAIGKKTASARWEKSD